METHQNEININNELTELKNLKDDEKDAQH